MQISPLSIGIDNNTLGQEIIGSNLGTIQTVRSAIVNALLGRELQLRHADPRR